MSGVRPAPSSISNRLAPGSAALSRGGLRGGRSLPGPFSLRGRGVSTSDVCPSGGQAFSARRERLRRPKDFVLWTPGVFQALRQPRARDSSGALFHEKSLAYCLTNGLIRHAFPGHDHRISKGGHPVSTLAVPCLYPVFCVRAVFSAIEFLPACWRSFQPEGERSWRTIPRTAGKRRRMVFLPGAGRDFAWFWQSGFGFVRGILGRLKLWPEERRRGPSPDPAHLRLRVRHRHRQVPRPQSLGRRRIQPGHRRAHLARAGEGVPFLLGNPVDPGCWHGRIIPARRPQGRPPGGQGALGRADRPGPASERDSRH